MTKLVTIIESRQDSIVRTLPDHVNKQRFMLNLKEVAATRPDLQTAKPSDVVMAVNKATRDGLMVDGREATLTTFKKKDGTIVVQYIPMITGILKMIRNSGEISGISAHVVYENDEFDHFLGDDEGIKHIPAKGNRGKPVAVYAIATYKDGFKDREVMYYDEIMAVKNCSRGSDSKFSPWSGDFATEMWRKTVIRRLAKRLPSSGDLDRVLRHDDENYDFDGGQQAPAKNITPEAETAPAEESKKLTTADVVKQKAKAKTEIKDDAVEAEVSEAPEAAPAAEYDDASHADDVI